ncbi:MAG: histidine phosphatase family protein [Nitrospirota bacterium]
MAPVWSTTLRPDTMIGQPLEKSDRERATMRDRKALRGSVLFCRHGATDYHPDRFYEEGEGPSLNADGLAQAEALGRWFARGPIPVEAVYVSPTFRTRQTVAPVERVLGLRATPLPEVAERSMGRWNGRLVDEVKRQDPEEWNRWKADPLGFAPPDGESLAVFGRRVDTALNDLMSRHAGGGVVIVTHVGTIRAALCAALGCPLEQGKRFVIEPGSVTRVDYTTSWPNLVFMGIQPT